MHAAVKSKVKKSVTTLGEMCFHKNKLDDFWVAFNDFVYDFTSYLAWQHPGGRKILPYVAGTDCSKYWDLLVSHDSRDRMVYSQQLSAYEVLGGLYERQH
jgi:cytochrome b involved in lipid metabolism